MDEKCAICREELAPGSFPQLQFDGTWVCQLCCSQASLKAWTAEVELREYERGQ